jgi:hypothetical protein
MPLSTTKFELSQQTIEIVPQLAGIYALWCEDEVIYIGFADETVGLRSQIMQHYRGTPECVACATHFQCDFCVECRPTAKEMMSRFVAKHGRSPRCNEPTLAGDS